MTDASFDLEEVKHVCERLAAIDEQLEALMALLAQERSSNIAGAEKRAVQERYARVKQELKEAYSESSTPRRRTQLNRAERAFWVHTVHQAFTQLREPTNATNRARLFSSLYDAHTTITHEVFELRRMLDVGPGEPGT